MKSIAAAIAFTVAVFWIIANDVPAMPSASLPARAFALRVEPLRVSPAGAASIDYRKEGK